MIFGGWGVLCCASVRVVVFRIFASHFSRLCSYNGPASFALVYISVIGIHRQMMAHSSLSKVHIDTKQDGLQHRQKDNERTGSNEVRSIRLGNYHWVCVGPGTALSAYKGQQHRQQ